MIRDAISKLVEDRPLTREDAHGALRAIMDGEATPAQIASFVTALRIRGETPEVIAGCAQAMREHLTPVRAAGDVVDTCGTGGDASNTFNISTAAAFVAAGAGVKVAKHGNRSVSSRCGSADVLAALGVDTACTPAVMERCLDRIGVAFLFAPTLHPAMKHALAPRREIGIRTVFNLLGPLSNPAGARRGVLGVFSAAMVPVMARAAADLGAERLFVVHGSDGLDEITLTGPSLVGEVAGGDVRLWSIDPVRLGFRLCPAAELKGGAPQENAVLLGRILDGEPGPRRDIVALNAAAAILAGGAAGDWASAIEAALRSIDSGAARGKLDALVRETRAGATA